MILTSQTVALSSSKQETNSSDFNSNPQNIKLSTNPHITDHQRQLQSFVNALQYKKYTLAPGRRDRQPERQIETKALRTGKES